MTTRSIPLFAALLALCLLTACGQPQSADQTEERPAGEAMEVLVSQVLLDQSTTGYMAGECAAEGHVILDTVQDEGVWQVYAIASVGQYGFCSGHFECVSGSGAIPTRITLTQDEDGTFLCQEVWEPMDGSYYADSIKETFPVTLWGKALNADRYYGDLKAQKEAYAQAYLDYLGREAPVGDYGDFDHPLFTDQGMSVEVSNDLITIEKLYPFPMHIGNVERVEEGVRYVYETAWDHQGNGVGTAVYTKYAYDTGEIAQQYTFQVEGDAYQESPAG